MPANPLPSKIGVVIFPGFQLLDWAGPLDAFHLLSNSHTLTLCTIAATMDPVPTQNFVQDKQGSQFSQTLVPTHTFDNAPDDLEVLLLPGGLGARDPESDKWMKPQVEYLKKLDLSGNGSIKWVLTVCTGSEILARAGLLDGRKATTNKRAFNDVCERTCSLFVFELATYYPNRLKLSTRMSSGLQRLVGLWTATSGLARVSRLVLT
jgi:putative intracellular protease/amidase